MYRLFVLLALSCPAFLAVDVPPPQRPNIIIMLVDDMGFSDLGCYGSEIPTPHIDKLAAGGVRFTQFYNTGRCCPTRASLLTGLYPHQAGVGHMTKDQEVPGYRGALSDTCVTVAEVARSAGYFTAMTGKWHVGQNNGVVPWERGFDRSLSAPAGGFYFEDGDRSKLFLDGKRLAGDDPKLPKGWYSTDLWTDFGLSFIDEARAAKKPFLLYLAHNAPHFPLQAPPEDIAKCRGTYRMGWDKLRELRYAKQIDLGLIDKAWPLAPRPADVQAWAALTQEATDRFDLLMAIYAACVSRLDASVGRLVAELKKRGELDNTLILIMSDNGGTAESGPDGRMKGKSAAGSRGSTVFYGKSWATLSNVPFRHHKHYSHEGGIASPLIAHWPAGITRAGTLRTQPSHLIDIMATCVDVSRATYPTEFNGKPITPMEGRSLVPCFSDRPSDSRALFWEHEGNAAVRDGDWKLVRMGRDGPWELYDLKADRTELRDMAATAKDRVNSLAAMWETWAVRSQVKPYPKEDNSTSEE